MAKKVKYSGLCLTCKNDPTCTLPRVSSIPMEQCEKYMSQESGGNKVAGRKDSETKSRKKVPCTAVETAREMGLCTNCESRETCIFPDARKGVKYCEEYQ